MTRSATAGIRTRLLMVFAVVAVLVLGTAMGGLLASRASSHAVHDVATQVLPFQRSVAAARSAVTASGTDLRGYLITGDVTLLLELEQDRLLYYGTVPSLRAQCAAVGARACRLVGQQEASARTWFDRYAAEVLAGQVSRRAATAQYVDSRRAMDVFTTVNNELSTVVDLEADRSLRAADRERALGLVLLSLSTLLVALSLVGLAWWTVRQVVPPLARLQEVLQRLASGDLEARMPVQGPAELQAVAAGVNLLAEQSLRLRDAEFVRAQTRGLTRDLDRRMRQHLDPDAVAEEVVRGLGQMARADRVHVRFVAGGRMGPVAAQWTTPALGRLLDERPQAGDPLESAGAVAARGHQTLVIEDVADYLQGGRAGRSAAAWARAYGGVGSMVIAPVLVGDQRIGVLVCARAPRTVPFGQADCGLVETVAADLARAVHHARLFEAQTTVVGQLRELDRTKSDFLSTISHELRTPLTSIAGYVEMMRDGDAGELQPMQANMLEIVGRNTQRLRDLIEDVLMISRVESGAVRSERMPVALGGVVDHVVTTLQPQADAAGVSIDVFPVPDEALLLGDPGQIDRMLLNLVGNAVKFTPWHGRVTVSAQVAGEEVRLQVQDTGIGIPAGELSSLFNRFYRATNATQRQIPGTGLGLAIIAGIAAAHEGRVDVDSVEGTGTTFTVTLPRWDADDVDAILRV